MTTGEVRIGAGALINGTEAGGYSTTEQVAAAIEASAMGVEVSVTESCERYVGESLDALSSEMETRLSQTASGLEVSLRESIADVAQGVDDASAALSDLQAYVRVEMSSGGEPVLRLGSSSSDLTAALTNGELGFYDSGLKVAYISNQRLHISAAEVTDSLTFGDWMWCVRSNGNMAFKWVG